LAVSKFLIEVMEATSPGGGQYFISYGAIIYGLFRLLRGLAAR
jgi:hypothetical protein